jgi:hypothetical protein
MEDDVRKSYEAGFQHHLVKPIDLNKLDSLIKKAQQHCRPRKNYSSALCFGSARCSTNS